MGLLFIQLIDSFTLYSSLTAHGMAEEAAQILKGIYDRGLPLIQLGTVVGTAFSLSLVPVISSAIAKKNLSFVVEKSSAVSPSIACSWSWSSFWLDCADETH